MTSLKSKCACSQNTLIWLCWFVYAQNEYAKKSPKQLDFVENTLEQKLLDLDIIEQVTNEELVNQESYSCREDDTNHCRKEPTTL